MADKDSYLIQSTFLSKMTHTESEAAAYEFTTLTVLSQVYRLTPDVILNWGPI